jgi:hypothetical protein
MNAAEKKQERKYLMHPLIHLKKVIPGFLIALTWFGLSQTVQAVLPPPDGGYPGGNTAEGQNALLSRTTGGFNTALGWFSLKSLTTGSFCTGVGAGTLVLNTGDENTAVGTGALLSNTTGAGNTANGAFALFGNTAGNFNTAVGETALFSNNGEQNTAIGGGALANNVSGSDNTAIGTLALQGNTAGGANTASGFHALFNNSTGVANTANGDGALVNNTTGSNNTALGSDAGIGVSTANNVIAIGTGGANVSSSCFIGNIRGVTTANADAIPVLIDSAGQLGTMSSSRRFKKEIKPMDQASEFIHALKPVTFHYKSDSSSTPQFGLIAEEVAEVNPDLVVRDENGEIYTVRYDAVNAMLLNEFLKEHRKVQAQDATIAQLKKDMETIVACLKEHDSKIQRVSARIEIGKTVGQTALNKP